MRCASVFGLVVCSASFFASGQQTGPAGSVPDVPAQAAHFAGPGVTAPRMLYPSVSVSRPEYCNQLNGLVRLTAIVNAEGVSRDVKTIRADDPRLGELADALIPLQRFAPGTYNGAPATVAVLLTVGLQTCVPETNRKHRDEDEPLILRGHPSVSTDVRQAPASTENTSGPSAVSSPDVAPAPAAAAVIAPIHADGDVSVPVPVLRPDPQYSGNAKRLKITGACIVGATIDTEGIPQNLHVAHSLDPGLDANVIETVKTWKFRPALQHGSVPVPFEVTIYTIFQRVAGTFVSYANVLPVSDKVLEDCSETNPKCSLRGAVALNADEVEARFIPSALDHHRGACAVSFVIDSHGIPRDMRVIQSLDPGFDDDVMDAAGDLRFKPAMRNGMPVSSPGVFLYKFRQHVAVDKGEETKSLLRAAVFHIMLHLMF